MYTAVNMDRPFGREGYPNIISVKFGKSNNQFARPSCTENYDAQSIYFASLRRILFF